MFKVKKEYAGIKVGTELNIDPSRQEYMVKNGYVEEVKADKPTENKAVAPKANKSPRKRKSTK